MGVVLPAVIWSISVVTLYPYVGESLSLTGKFEHFSYY